MVAALAAAVEAAWATDTLAGLADSSATLADGTELLVGCIAFAEGTAFSLPPDAGEPPEFAGLAGWKLSLSSVTCSAGLPLAFLLTAAQSSSCALRPARTLCRARDQ